MAKVGPQTALDDDDICGDSTRDGGRSLPDIRREWPIENFDQMVRRGKMHFAASSLELVLLGLIPEGVDDGSAIECVTARRCACVVQKEVAMLNDFVTSLVARL